MAIKELQTRIALKYDSYENWTKTQPDDSKVGANLVLLKGELGICEIPSDFSANGDSRVMPTVLFKVGDGTKKFHELPWASAKAADVYSWAKSEIVVLDGTTIKFKTGSTVNHTIDLSSFATDAEVETIRAGLASRIAAVEAKFTGDGSVQGQIDAIDGRLDVIEGSGDGSVAKALVDAKAYTDARETAIETAYKAYADQAEADAISAAETASENKVKVERARIATLESDVATIKGEDAGSIKKAVADAVTEVKAYADTAETDAVNAAKSYTDGRETLIRSELKTAYETYADQAEADAKSYVDGKVSTINAKDSAQDTAIEANATAISTEKSRAEGVEAKIREDFEAADLAINNKIGTLPSDYTTVVAGIAAAKQAGTDAATAVDNLSKGQVATNKADIAQLRTDLNSEITNRTNADNALDERLAAVEAFFEGAAKDEGEGESLKNALDTLKEIQEFATGEGTAAEEILAAVGQNATDIDNLEKEFADGGRVKVAENKIASLEGRATNLEAADTRIDGRIDALVDDNGTIATGDAATLAAAKKYAEDEADAAEAAAKSHAEQKASAAQSAAEATAASALSSAVGTLNAKDTEIEGKVTTLQNLTSGFSGTKAIYNRVEEVSGRAEQGITDAAAAQSTANTAVANAKTAQAEVDALEIVVAGVKTTADNAKSDLAALTTRVGTAEDDIDALEVITKTGDDANSKLRADITSLQTLTGANGAIRSEIADAKKAGTDAAAAVDALSKGQVTTNKNNIEGLDGRVSAIEGDYLKAADAYVFNCGTSTTVTHTA